jgi:hypothetical protein
MYAYYDWYFVRAAMLALVLGAFAACALLAALWRKRGAHRDTGGLIEQDASESKPSLFSTTKRGQQATLPDRRRVA